MQFVRADYRPDAVVKLVLDDMAARDKTGRERYGVPLTADNGRNALVDAYQESMDKAVYLRAELDRRGIDPSAGTCGLTTDNTMLVRMFADEIDDIMTLRELLS